MTLGNATTPERVIRAFGQNAIRVEACDREHAWVPTYRDDADLACFFSCCIDCCEVLRDVRVRVERIDHVEEFGVFRRLFGQVSCGTTTQHEHVDIVRMGFDIVNREDGNASGERSDGAWVATREDGDQLDGRHFDERPAQHLCPSFRIPECRCAFSSCSPSLLRFLSLLGY